MDEGVDGWVNSKMDKNTSNERACLVVDQYGGILPYYEAFYIHSIIYSAERSLAAFERFTAALAGSGSESLIVASVQEALAHAAAVSRFFWPMHDENRLAVARGNRLKNAFELGDSSPMKWRKLRNAFEHFDEDLDKFLLQDQAGHFFPGPLVAPHGLANESNGHIFRLVDPENGICVLLGEKFEFRPIQQEVRRVLLRAQEMDSKGCRLPVPA